MSRGPSPLSKAGAERLLGAIDTDLLYGEFVRAVRSVLGVDETRDDVAVLERAADAGRWSSEVFAAVIAKDEGALTWLAIELCELRVLGDEGRFSGEGH